MIQSAPISNVGLEMSEAKLWYACSDHQPAEFADPPPAYVGRISALVRHLLPHVSGAGVFEFGCGSGRIQPFLSHCQYSGMDLNVKAVEHGRKLGRRLFLGDERSLPQIIPIEADVCLSVSALAHLADPSRVMGCLLRRPFTILYEPVMESVTDSMRVTRMDDENGNEVAGYPFSYFHDYRRLAEQSRACVLDVPLPAYPGNLGEYYRLMLFSYRPVDLPEADFV